MITVEQANNIAKLLKSDHEDDNLLGSTILLDLYNKGEVPEKFFVWCIGYIPYHTKLNEHMTTGKYWGLNYEKYFYFYPVVKKYEPIQNYDDYSPLKDGL